MAQVSGLLGNVFINNVQFPFGKWSGTITTKQIPRNNWLAAGFQRLVSGFTDGAFSIEGPWDVGNTPLIAGATYTFIFYVTATVGFQVPCNVETISPSDDSEGAPDIKVNLKSNGVFTAAVV